MPAPQQMPSPRGRFPVNESCCKSREAVETEVAVAQVVGKGEAGDSSPVPRQPALPSPPHLCSHTSLSVPHPHLPNAALGCLGQAGGRVPKAGSGGRDRLTWAGAELCATGWGACGAGVAWASDHPQGRAWSHRVGETICREAGLLPGPGRGIPKSASLTPPLPTASTPTPAPALGGGQARNPQDSGHRAPQGYSSCPRLQSPLYLPLESHKEGGRYSGQTGPTADRGLWGCPSGGSGAHEVVEEEATVIGAACALRTQLVAPLCSYQVLSVSWSCQGQSCGEEIPRHLPCEANVTPQCPCPPLQPTGARALKLPACGLGVSQSYSLSQAQVLNPALLPPPPTHTHPGLHDTGLGPGRCPTGI